jgi:hypothetical protein
MMKWIICGLLCITVTYVLIEVTQGQAAIGEFPYNTPDPVGCDFAAITAWVAKQNSQFWTDLANRRDVQGMCTEISFIITSAVKCVDVITGLIAPGTQIEGWADVSKYTFAVVAHFQNFCGIVDSSKLTICNIGGVIECSAAAVIGFQQSLALDLTDLGKICVYYNDLVSVSKSCMNNVYDGCPASDADSAAIYSQVKVVYGYLDSVSQYCQDDCGEIINFLAEQNDKCPKIWTYNWQGLDIQNYCTTIKEYITCIEYLTTSCNLLPRNVISPAAQWTTLLISLLGCTGFGFQGYTVDNLPRSTEIAIPCASGMFQCSQTIFAIFGLTPNAGPDGGWNVNGVTTSIDSISQNLLSGQYTQVCSEVTKFYQPMVNCTSAVIDDCIPGISANSDAMLARMIIVDNITHYLDQLCSSGCSDLQGVFTNIATSCDQSMIINGIDWSTLPLETFLAFFQSNGASSSSVCKLANSYMNCVLPQLLKCPFLYDNWQMIAQMYIRVNFEINICGLFFNLNSGRIELNGNAPGPIFNVRAGTSRPEAYTQTCTMMLILSVIWKIIL